MKFKRLLVSTLFCTWLGQRFNYLMMAPLFWKCWQPRMWYLYHVLQKMFSSSPSRLPKMTSSEENLWHLLIRAGMQKKLLGCTLFLSHRLFSFLIDSSLGKLFSSKNIKMQWPKDIPIQFYITITILPIFQTTISSSNGWWLVDGCHQNIGCGYKLFSVSTMFLYWHSLTNAMDNCSWNVSI